MNKQINMTKLTVALRDIANAPKQHSVSRRQNYFFFTSGAATNNIDWINLAPSGVLKTP
jgi:hypothetical protein